MTIEKITDMAALAKDRLIEQFKNKDNIEKMVEMFAEELQELEDAAIDLKDDLNLTNAVGANLDVLGEHLGKRRSGESDDAYREILRVQVGVNTSDGAEQPLYDVFKLLTDSTVAIITESFPAEVTIFGNGSMEDVSTATQLQKVLAATVQANFVLSNGVPFGFEGGEAIGGGFTSIHTGDPASEGDGSFSTLISGA